MKYLQKLYNELEKQEKLHQKEIFNYAVPESWNLYGYSEKKTIRSKEILVNPYAFYLFTLRHILKDEKGRWKKALPLCDASASKGDWLKKSSLYSLMVRTAASWDHDRDDRIDHDNLYHLSDNGTFLKSILLLPMIKRMGIDTILMHQPFALAKTQEAHDYAAKESVMDFQRIDEALADPLVEELNAKEQCAAFIEACHLMGIRVILEYCPGKLARDNVYVSEHPEWFYWIREEEALHYTAPVCHGLPQNTIPHTYTLKDFYRSEDVQRHIATFTKAPEVGEATSGKVIAPAMSDQINANIPADKDATIFRFYEDLHSHVPAEIKKSAQPYLMQDTIRNDLHPGRKPLTDLWELLNENITWYQSELGIDGLYLEKPYLLPEKLQKQFVKTARRKNRKFAMIAEDAAAENSQLWLNKGYDAISGKSGYEESDIWNFKFHSFAYQLKGNACPMLAASEFYDSRRVSCLDGGKTLANMLSVMNQFLPNGIPMMMNGIESYEVQPMQLSEYGDKKYLYSLGKDDPRYLQQAYLDHYYFNYRSSDLMVLPSLMEQTSKLRRAYLDAITTPERCIPVWFDTPRDYGIGFTFVLEDKALLVVCNTNVHDTVHLHIHTENMFCELPFAGESILQIFSTEDPYIHDIYLNDFRNIPLDFAPGEVKFIEIKPKQA